MSEQPIPYIEQNPGDLITAENWNELQRRIKADIGNKIGEAVDGIESVPQAGDAEKLGGKTVDELTDEIVERAIAEIRTRRGYLYAFRILQLGKVSEIHHDFQAFPLVDVYQLDYFPVVCCVDEDIYPAWATFYLYHTSESASIRYPKGDDYERGKIEIEGKDPVYKIPFLDMLQRYDVNYTENSSLGDLETEFWKVFFADPNDKEFDDQACHSPWFERCCREERTVKKLKSMGDLNDLWFLVKPRKTINYPGGMLKGERVLKWEFPSTNATVLPAPTQVQVCQYDFKTVGLTLLSDPIYPADQLASPSTPKDQPPGSIVDQFGNEVLQELKVMVLLKC